MTAKQAPSSLSARIVGYLLAQGKTLKEVGKSLNLSESFLSRVARGERRLSVEHLDRLEAAFGQPLPLLLLQASAGEVPEQHRPMYSEALRLLQMGAALRRPSIPDELVLATHKSPESLRALQDHVVRYIRDVAEHLAAQKPDMFRAETVVRYVLDQLLVQRVDDEYSLVLPQNSYVSAEGLQRPVVLDILAGARGRPNPGPALEQRLAGLVRFRAARASRN